MSATPSHRDQEKIDAQKVSNAVNLISIGNLIAAKQMLVDVINNVPAHYAHTTKIDEDTVEMRFWDQNEFIHYVAWQKPTTKIKALLAAYPRAYYYLGFIAIAENDYQSAIKFLDRGRMLEATNPNFLTEKAHALIKQGKFTEAFAIYNQISTLGPFVSAEVLALALRGKGAALVEMGDLLDAEQAYRESLKYAPTNELAMRELRYIENLMFSGGLKRAPLETYQTKSALVVTCKKCGAMNVSGNVFVVDQIEYFFCNVCRPVEKSGNGSVSGSDVYKPAAPSPMQPGQAWHERAMSWLRRFRPPRV
jgi:tetratricopeptide (TPR) repeat protein